MELIKGAPVSAKIKEEVGAMLEKINGPAPKLAIVRVGENPDDMSYERGAVKKMDAFGLRSQCYTFPADITDEDFKKRIYCDQRRYRCKRYSSPSSSSKADL